MNLNVNSRKLTVPICIQGCKARIAHKIVNWFPLYNEPNFYDICCGSGAISIALVRMGYPPEKITMVDSSMWGVFWDRIGEGTFPLETLEKWIRVIPKQPRRQPKFFRQLARTWLMMVQPPPRSLVDEMLCTFLLLQSASFSGQIPRREEDGNFKVYIRKYRKGHPVLKPHPKNLIQRIAMLAEHMKGVRGRFMTFRDLYIPHYEDHTIVYIDPPYYGHGCPYPDHIMNSELNVWIRGRNGPVYVSYNRPLTSTYIPVHNITRNRCTNLRGGMHHTRRHEFLNIFNTHYQADVPIQVNSDLALIDEALT